MNTRQDGSVMVISLLVLLVATLMSIAGISTSQLQERIAANQKQTVVAQMAAESGASKFVGWLQGEMKESKARAEEVWGTDVWQEFFPSTLDTSSIDERGQIGDQGFFWVANAEIIVEGVEGDEQEFWEILISGHVRDSSGGVLSTQKISYKIGRPDEPTGEDELPVHKAFGSGLLAENNIRINGNATLIASAHANGSIRITGGDNYVTGNLSAVNYVDVSSVPEEQLFPGAPSVDIPRVTEEFLAEMRDLAMATDTNNQYYGANQSCDLTLSGNYGGILIYCAGDMIIRSPKQSNNWVSFSDVTIVSTGSITYNGASSLGENDMVTVAMIANDSITFNGSSTSYGVFWLNGDYVHNGQGTVEGAIVSAGRWNQIEADAEGEIVIGEVVDEDSGSITRNGVFAFTGNGNVANPHLPRATLDDDDDTPTNAVLISEWKQVF